MVAQYSLIASLAAALIICATAELPTEENSVLASEDGLVAANSDLEFEENFAAIEDLRQKREALPEKKKNGKKGKERSAKNGGGKKKSEKNGGGKKKNGNGRSAKNGGRRNEKGTRRSAKNGGGRTKKGEGRSAKNGGGKQKKGRKEGRSAKNGGGKQKKGKGRSAKNGGRKKDKGKGKSAKNGSGIKKKGEGRSAKNTKGKKGESKNGKGKKSIANGGRKKNKGKSAKKGGGRSKKGKGRSAKNTKGKKGESKNGKGKTSIANKGKKNNNRKKKKIDKKSKPKKSSNKPSQRQTTNATVALTCLKDAVLYTKFLKDQVINFLRRNTRLETQNTLTNKKAGKKGEFQEPMARIIQAGGGDRQNLTCGGSTTGTGAKMMKNITDILDGCAVAIKNACKPHTGNTTQRTACVTAAKLFNTTIVGCVAKATRGQDACSCFQADAVKSEKKTLESCKGTSDGKKAAAARTACLKQLSKCKTASSTAGTLQYACKYTEGELTAILKQLSENKAAFGKLLKKIEALTGIKADPPGGANTTRVRREETVEDIDNSQQSRNRGKREEKACSEVIVTLQKCIDAIENTPASPKTSDACKEPTYTIAACTDADKASIKTKLNEALVSNGLIIAFSDSVKAELSATTGSTPSDSQISAATKKTAARSRSILRKMIMEKMQLRN